MRTLTDLPKQAVLRLKYSKAYSTALVATTKLRSAFGFPVSMEKIIPARPKVGFALLIQDRPEYLIDSLRSLLETKLVTVELTILLHDDGSTSEATKKIIKSAKSDRIKIIKYRKDRPSGSWGGAFNSAMSELIRHGNFDIIGSGDSDAYFHPGWLEESIKVARYAKKHYKKHILGPFSSFNSSDYRFHKVIDKPSTPYGAFWVKERMGALNYLYCYKDYIKLGRFVESRDDETLMTERFKKYKVRNFCTEISYVEHIGEDSILNKFRPVPVKQAVHALNLIKDGWVIPPQELSKSGGTKVYNAG